MFELQAGEFSVALSTIYHLRVKLENIFSKWYFQVAPTRQITVRELPQKCYIFKQSTENVTFSVNAILPTSSRTELRD